jgi:hypothetical protein
VTEAAAVLAAHASEPAPPIVGRSEEHAEQTEFHTRILRLALGIEESRAYWERVDPAVAALAPGERAARAFDERWFGPKSVERVKLLLANFAVRYDAYPPALAVLHRWNRMDGVTRALVCHWHLQLADPLYRRFSGEFLVARRAAPGVSEIRRDVVVRWVEERVPGRWGASTIIQFASKLLSAAFEAGLVGGTRDPRPIVLPRVSDLALGYCLHLLREVRFEGSLLANPYLASVGLGSDVVEARLRTLAGVRHHRMGDLHEFEWDAASLAEWAAHRPSVEGIR